MTPSFPQLHRYQRIAQEIESMISAGTLQAGDRLPSVRHLGASRGVSVPTVVQAYRLLEARRIVRARPKAGFFVVDRREARQHGGSKGVAPPAPVTTGGLIVELLEMVGNPSLVPLGTALPDPSLLPTAKLARMLGRTARRDAARHATLFTPMGTEELRKEIARRAMFDGGATSHDDVVITCGCAEAISLCLRAVTRPGDAVAIESPTYFGTLQTLEFLGLRAVEIPMTSQGISLETLEKALNAHAIRAMVVTPTVHNPLGTVMPEAHRRELLELAKEHQLTVIEDETYSELAFDAPAPPSLRALDTEGTVLSCGSFSKTLAPGYRLGWTIAGRFRDDILRIKLATTVGSPVPPQLAVAELLVTGGVDSHLRRMRRDLLRRRDISRRKLLEHLPEGSTLSAPAGGLLFWVELPDGSDAISLQRAAFAEGISVAAGPAFSAGGHYRDCLRVNFSYGWTPEIERAVGRIRELAG